jgi:hypothetical protein
MWRPDLKHYNAFVMAKSAVPAKPGNKNRAGLTFPLPTLISNMFQVPALDTVLCVSTGAA